MTDIVADIAAQAALLIFLDSRRLALGHRLLRLSALSSAVHLRYFGLKKRERIKDAAVGKDEKRRK